MAFVPLHLLRTLSIVLRTVMISVLADPTVQDVNVVLTDVAEVVETVLLVGHVLEQEDVSATEIVLARNAGMTVVTPEISVISVVLLKSVELISDVLEHAPLTAVTPTDPSDSVVMMVVSGRAENVPPFQDRISDAETDCVSADLNVTISNVVLMVAEETVELVPEMPPVSMEVVSTPFWDVVEMVSVNPL